MRAAFGLARRELGKVSQVASEMIELEGVSEIHSSPGPHEPLVTPYAPRYDDFGDLGPDISQKVHRVRVTETFQAVEPT